MFVLINLHLQSCYVKKQPVKIFILVLKKHFEDRSC